MSSARILLRTGGLGDVLMTLAAAKAMKAMTGDQILLATSERYADIARACPHVDHVMTVERLSPTENRAIELGRRLGRFLDLNPVMYGIAREHQVDAYLWAAGLEAPASLKDVELRLPEAVIRSTRTKARRAGVQERSVVLHPARGDANRTWPAERWTELAKRLTERGNPVALIGAADADKGAVGLPASGCANLIGQLDALETVALLRDSAALITTDSGPVQLAAATDVAIVAIFSVVRGANRLPFRHGVPAWRAVPVEPACPSFPCYRSLNRPEVLNSLVNRTNESGLSLSQALGTWCEQPQRFACLQGGIEADVVLRHFDDLVDREPAARSDEAIAQGHI